MFFLKAREEAENNCSRNSSDLIASKCSKYILYCVVLIAQSVFPFENPTPWPSTGPEVVFAQLAHRLGVWLFKTELEDLSFQYLYPLVTWMIWFFQSMGKRSI